MVIKGNKTAGTPLGTNILKYLKPCLANPIIVTAIKINSAIINVTIMTGNCKGKVTSPPCCKTKQT